VQIFVVFCFVFTTSELLVFLWNIAKSESSDFLQSEMTWGILAREGGAMLVPLLCLEMMYGLE
jgi:hypothetical protein